MAEINYLSDELINKIAAGEVVERPASVVKELVENAIDAGASNIRIELREGGIEQILVQDDGKGMSREDCELSIKRHTTSKICSEDDLFAIDTMGFRGEALASISSVAEFCILTRKKTDQEGTKLLMSKDGQLDVQTWNGAFGTTIIVNDLFSKIPARKAFLKKPNIEYSYILEVVQSLALNTPQISLTLVHNGREVFRAPGHQSTEDHDYFRGEDALRARMSMIIDEAIVKKLVYCREENTHGIIEALISPPGVEKPTSKFMFTFVNGRFVKDKTMRYGITRGYYSHLLKGKYPIVLMHLSIDPSLVDVNVHPSKAEVRFQYMKEVQDLIAQTIKKSLRAGAWAFEPSVSPSTPKLPDDFDLLGAPPRGGQTTTELGASFDNSDATRGLPGRGEASARFGSYEASSSRSQGCGTSQMPHRARDLTVSVSRMSFGADSASDPKTPPHSSSSSLRSQVQEQVHEEIISWASLKFVGSFRKCYLMFEQEQGLLVVDQHAFHERILYERFVEDYKNLGPRQSLLMPEAIELDQLAYADLELQKDHLQTIGFDVQFLQNEIIEVNAVPSLLVKANLEAVFAELAEQANKACAIHSEESSFSHKILSTMACHAAVRSGEDIDEVTVHDFLAEAANVDFFLNCPHGRRVFRTFSKHDVEQWFDR